MKKKIIRTLLAVLAVFLMYIALNIYQSENIEIIPFEDINKLHVSDTKSVSSDTTITGTANIGQFESVSVNNLIVVEDTLYVIIYKWPTFFSNDKIDIKLKNVGGLDEVSKMSIVWGDIYSNEGSARGFSHSDLVKHPDQQIFWLKKGRESE
ncbi:hypothetical protein [Alkalibacterium kapii]|uniref:Uncharacterized protein n=1 Tax=Alkalibacterium kapii TaxID=426704 RepID=A0A511ARC5_9LACT|nr:hypothetical protein [Alkalibacterium kapii]GEK90738.1 hypothetical protein AKA01nite_03600 [Alkalibacterium kapii]